MKDVIIHWASRILPCVIAFVLGFCHRTRVLNRKTNEKDNMNEKDT